MLGLTYICCISQPIYSVPVHKHDIWEIVYYTKGEGRLEVGDKVFNFKPMDMYCIPPNIPHYDESPEGYQNIHLSVKCLPFPGYLNELIYIKDTASQDLLNLLLKLNYEYYLKRKNWINITESLADALFQFIISMYPEYNHPLIEKIINMIITNLSNPDFKFKDIYDKIPMSPNHLRNLFKEKTGKNPLQYLNEKRIEYAKHMLEYMYPNIKTISEIASLCGYSDQYYFSRSFKKTTGMAPSEWSSQQEHQINNCTAY